MARMLTQSCTVRPSAFSEKLPEQHLGGFEMDLLTRLTKEPLPFATLLGIEIVIAASLARYKTLPSFLLKLS